MSGAAGRMGRAIIGCQKQAGLELVGALERSGSEYLGKDAGTLAGIDELGISITSDAGAALKDAAAVIDFSSPENTLALAEVCAQNCSAGLTTASGTSDTE